MTHSYVERELKFDVDPTFVLPPLAQLLPKGGKLEARSGRLRSDYYDTVDHALLRARMTLRRRTGTADTGWQLKVPHEPFREEIRLGDAGSESVPEELNRLLLGVTGGRDLIHIAGVVTERSSTRLLDAKGRLLAEIADDNVHASSSAGTTGVLTRWREVEIELGDDETELLYALGKRLRRAGARPSRSASKLARALPAQTQPKDRKRTDSKRDKRTAGAVIAAYIAEQHQAILAGDLALRRGDESVVHKTRVATRRLRSTLRVFGSLYDPQRTTWLDTELRWYAGLLGAVRDRQVLRKRLGVMISEVDDTLLLGPVRSRVDTELGNEQREHWQRLQHDITQDRYLTLLAEIANWVEHPPETPAAARPAKTLAALAKRADRQVSRKLRRANKSGDVHLLHSARKAAKRARYAAEAITPLTGSKAAQKHAHRYQKLQDLLGEHQDSLVSAELIRRLATKAGTVPGENGFSFGILHEREQQNARIARKEARKIAKQYA